MGSHKTEEPRLRELDPWLMHAESRNLGSDLFFVLCDQLIFPSRVGLVERRPCRPPRRVRPVRRS